MAARPASRRAPARTRSCSSCGCRPTTTRRSACRCRSSGRRGDDVFAFVRAGDPRRRPRARPRRAAAAPRRRRGSSSTRSEPFAVELDAETVSYFLRDLMPRLEELDVPVAAAVGVAARADAAAANLTARSEPFAQTRAGCSRPSVLASFDWRLAVGDTELTDEELRALAAAKEPVVQVDGRWHALRARRGRSARCASSSGAAGRRLVELVRAVSGLETDEAGLELGDGARSTRSLDELLAGEDARFRPRGTPAAMRHDLFPFQERGHGWLRLLGDLGIGGDPRRRHGARQDGAGDRDARLRARGGRGGGVRADARRLPDERRAAVGGGDRSASRRRCACICITAATGSRTRSCTARRTRSTSSSRRTTSRRATSRRSPTVDWDRLLLDEAQDVKNPPTKRARALRPLQARRRVAMTGTPIENRLERAVGDHGHRQPRPARLARVVRADVRAADRGREATRRRSSGCGRWCGRSSCGGRRTSPRSSSSCRRSRSRRTTAG